MFKRVKSRRPEELSKACHCNDIDVEVAECIDVHEGLDHSIVVSPKETVWIISKTSSRVTNEGIDCVGKYGDAVNNCYNDRRYDALPSQTISSSLSRTSSYHQEVYRGYND